MSKHMKRLNVPRVVRLHRKERAWSIRTSPGPHKITRAIPLGLIVRDYLKLTDTQKETKNVLSNQEIVVDGKIVKNHKYPCGLMDVISIPTLKKDYRILFDKRGKLTLVPIKTDDAKWKLCKIENKTIVKGKKIQLNLHDGRNKLVEKDQYKTGDVLKISFEDQKIDDIYKFEKGAVSIIIGGSHIGEVANIGEIETTISSKSNLIKMKGSTEFTTLQQHVFPIGKTNPSIELPEVKIQ
jgi:small subunit ribosomal protein S4e